MRGIFLFSFITLFSFSLHSQTDFDYHLQLTPLGIPGLPGLHSYVYGQSNGKWLLIGGRKDGLHARQPFNAFPESQNNAEIFVVDVNAGQYWSASVATLPVGIKEQLQSTNMNFHQWGDTLYIAGGYAYSATANNHKTFHNLTTLDVPSLMNAIIAGNSITPYFKQITDSVFAVTGGQLGRIGNTFYLVGGHRFDGRYNAMGQPSYTQTYTNQIRKFTVDNSGSQLVFSNYSAITDPVHLRRRDYNLMPQIFPDGSEGYLISSGVFQENVDLPFLYPVEITANGHNPITSFNQYLSNYHGARASLYDSINNRMHMLFFGGLSQYYYQNGSLVQDNLVPFVKTISRLSRDSSGTLAEYQLPVEMPLFQGTGAEFILNTSVSHTASEVIRLSTLSNDTTVIGYVYGGIKSPSLNPFSNNQTSTTTADNTLYAVKLIKGAPVSIYEIDGKNPFDISLFPNPVSDEFTVSFSAKPQTGINWFLTNASGQIIDKGQADGAQTLVISIHPSIPPQILSLTVVFDGKFFVSRKLVRR